MMPLDPLPPLKNDITQSAVRDEQCITREWQPVQDLIEGVVLREVKHVCKQSGGVLTEIYRRDWHVDEGQVEQVFQNVLEPGQISGWHLHEHTTDRIFVTSGMLKIVLFDGRRGSPSCGRINDFCFGTHRPTLLVIPAGVWHAVKNVGSEQATLVNMVDSAYSYEQPDHWRLPSDSDQIPYVL